MRVRLFELRLLALLLFVLWSAFFAAVLVGYHPGGPLDWVVGATAVSPVIVAALGVLWPPLATGNRASSALGWLGILAALLLIPSIQNLAGFLLGTAGQPLLPAPEVAYAAVVALFATCLFAGLGVARQILGPGAHRRRRLGLGVLVAIAMTALAASPFTATALANEIAIRSRTPPASAYGPVGPDAAPPACDGALVAGPFAEISETATAAVVATRVGNVALAGARSGADERWSASQALHGEKVDRDWVRVGGNAWERRDGGPWERVDASPGPPSATLDEAVVEQALRRGQRAGAEDLGIELVGGARARHCRTAVTGGAAGAAFPPLDWLTGAGAPASGDLSLWRGDIDWWVFGDGELGMASVRLTGVPPGSWGTGGILGVLEARLTATHRSVPQAIVAPD